MLHEKYISAPDISSTVEFSGMTFLCSVLIIARGQHIHTSSLFFYLILFNLNLGTEIEAKFLGKCMYILSCLELNGSIYQYTEYEATAGIQVAQRCIKRGKDEECQLDCLLFTSNVSSSSVSQHLIGGTVVYADKL